MARWWTDNSDERYWTEIRRVPGIGTDLICPDRSNAWYDLLLEVAEGDVIYHWDADQHRFVGRSQVEATCSIEDGERVVPLTRFETIDVPVTLAHVRAREELIRGVRDSLAAAYPDERLYLPFQFRSDGLRFMSNYFAKLPAALVEPLFGGSGLAREAEDSPPEGEGPDEASVVAFPRATYLRPFKAKADTDYFVRIQEGPRRRGRYHETLVNDFSVWLSAQGLTVGRNAAIDIGIADPPVIIEAKMVPSSWSGPIREAVGQLYEYRHFQVCSPDADLVFLSSKPLPKEWVRYLENDRGIGVAWREGTSWHISEVTRRALGL